MRDSHIFLLGVVLSVVLFLIIAYISCGLQPTQDNWCVP